MKTFNEYLRWRMNEDDSTSPQQTQAQNQITPALQNAARTVMTKMPNLMPTDPKIPMAQWLQKNPNLLPDFTKRLLADPSARGSNITADQARSLLVGTPGQPLPSQQTPPGTV